MWKVLVLDQYTKDVLATVDVPNIQLKGFEKVFIPAGETVEVAIELDVNEVGRWDKKMKYVVEPGEFRVYMGRSSADRAQVASFYVS